MVRRGELVSRAMKSSELSAETSSQACVQPLHLDAFSELEHGILAIVTRQPPEEFTVPAT
jgi:hypothetical protein